MQLDGHGLSTKISPMVGSGLMLLTRTMISRQIRLHVISHYYTKILFASLTRHPIHQIQSRQADARITVLK